MLSKLGALAKIVSGLMRPKLIGSRDELVKLESVHVLFEKKGI